MLKCRTQTLSYRRRRRRTTTVPGSTVYSLIILPRVLPSVPSYPLPFFPCPLMFSPFFLPLSLSRPLKSMRSGELCKLPNGFGCSPAYKHFWRIFRLKSGHLLSVTCIMAHSQFSLYILAVYNTYKWKKWLILLFNKLTWKIPVGTIWGHIPTNFGRGGDRHHCPMELAAMSVNR